MVKLAAIADRAAVLLGAVLVVWGTAMLSRPLATILAGLLLLAGALWRTRP